MTSRKSGTRKYAAGPRARDVTLNTVDTGSTGEASAPHDADSSYQGTGSARANLDAEYYDAPLPSPGPKSGDRRSRQIGVGEILAAAALIIPTIIFFVHLDTNVSSVHGDVKEVKMKVERVENSVNQQGMKVESMSASVRELSQEARKNKEALDDLKHQKTK